MQNHQMHTFANHTNRLIKTKSDNDSYMTYFHDQLRDASVITIYYVITEVRNQGKKPRNPHKKTKKD